MDAKTVFLIENFEKEIYMEQHEDFVIHGEENWVCKLDKFVYGLKQAPMQYYENFDSLIPSIDFEVNESDMHLL